jgi:hypothetical protein
MDLSNSFWCVIGHFEGDLGIKSILGYFVFTSQDYQAEGSNMVNTLNFTIVFLQTIEVVFT